MVYKNDGNPWKTCIRSSSFSKRSSKRIRFSRSIVCEMARATILFLLVVAIAYASAFPQEPNSEQECGPNEVFNSCGSPCEPKCGAEASPICTLRCMIGCQCKSGYVRNKDNQCVLTRDC